MGIAKQFMEPLETDVLLIPIPPGLQGSGVVVGPSTQAGYGASASGTAPASAAMSSAASPLGTPLHSPMRAPRPQQQQQAPSATLHWRNEYEPYSIPAQLLACMEACSQPVQMMEYLSAAVDAVCAEANARAKAYAVREAKEKRSQRRREKERLRRLLANNGGGIVASADAGADAAASSVPSGSPMLTAASGPSSASASASSSSIALFDGTGDEEEEEEEIQVKPPGPIAADDLIPLLNYVCSRSPWRRPHACLSFVANYGIPPSGATGKEGFVITMVQSCVQWICTLSARESERLRKQSTSANIAAQAPSGAAGGAGGKEKASLVAIGDRPARAADAGTGGARAPAAATAATTVAPTPALPTTPLRAPPGPAERAVTSPEPASSAASATKAARDPPATPRARASTTALAGGSYDTLTPVLSPAAASRLPWARPSIGSAQSMVNLTFAPAGTTSDEPEDAGASTGNDYKPSDSAVERRRVASPVRRDPLSLAPVHHSTSTGSSGSGVHSLPPRAASFNGVISRAGALAGGRGRLPSMCEAQAGAEDAGDGGASSPSARARDGGEGDTGAEAGTRERAQSADAAGRDPVRTLRLSLSTEPVGLDDTTGTGTGSGTGDDAEKPDAGPVDTGREGETSLSFSARSRGSEDADQDQDQDQDPDQLLMREYGDPTGDITTATAARAALQDSYPGLAEDEEDRASASVSLRMGTGTATTRAGRSESVTSGATGSGNNGPAGAGTSASASQPKSPPSVTGSQSTGTNIDRESLLGMDACPPAFKAVSSATGSAAGVHHRAGTSVSTEAAGMDLLLRAPPKSSRSNAGRESAGSNRASTAGSAAPTLPGSQHATPSKQQQHNTMRLRGYSPRVKVPATAPTPSKQHGGETITGIAVAAASAFPSSSVEGTAAGTSTSSEIALSPHRDRRRVSSPALLIHVKAGAGATNLPPALAAAAAEAMAEIQAIASASGETDAEHDDASIATGKALASGLAAEASSGSIDASKATSTTGAALAGSDSSATPLVDNTAGGADASSAAIGFDASVAAVAAMNAVAAVASAAASGATAEEMEDAAAYGVGTGYTYNDAEEPEDEDDNEEDAAELDTYERLADAGDFDGSGGGKEDAQLQSLKLLLDDTERLESALRMFM